MKTPNASKRSAKPDNRLPNGGSRHGWRLLPLLLLLLLSATVHAQFQYTVDQGKVTITGYTGPGGTVVIPDTIGGLAVTRVGNAAFRGCTSLTSIIVADSVASVGIEAFEGCTSLTSVTIGSGVTDLHAFDGC